MGTNIRLRRGAKVDLPSCAPSGTPLWCEDTQELFIGTGDGIAKIGVENLLNSIDTTNPLNPIGVSSSDTNSFKRNTSISMNGGILTAKTFVGDLEGNSNTTTKLKTARTINLSGDIVGSGTFDGSSNLNISTKLNGDFYPLFSTMTFDRTLNADESVGWLEQGSLVTNVYPEAVTKITNEYDNGIAKTQLIEEHWVQPILSANGTLGGSTFAVVASSELKAGYEAFQAFRANDDATYWHSAAQTDKKWFLTFYNPTALKVSKLDLRIHATDDIPSGGILQGSNNGTSWVDICNFTNTTALNQCDQFSIDASNNSTFYKYYKILFTGSNSASYVNITEVNIWATYLVNSIPYRLATNGHKIALIAHKSVIDDLYNRTGVADFYILDKTNKQFYLPKDIGAPTTRHLIKSMRSGTEWMDLYNDGWVKQGGIYVQYTNSSAKTNYNYIKLHRLMREIEYSIKLNATDCAYNGTNVSTWSRSTTGFYTYTADAYKKMMWEVVGRTAQPTLSEYDSDILNRLLSKKKYYKVGTVITNKANIDIASILADVSKLQTQIEAKAEKSSIPVGLFTKFYESPKYSFVSSSWVTIDHNLGLTNTQIQRAVVIPYLICTSSIAGYALNQIIPMPQIIGYNEYPVPQPYFLTSNKFEQRTGDSYAFWLNRQDRSYGHHFLTTTDIVNCFKYFFRIWY